MSPAVSSVAEFTRAADRCPCELPELRWSSGAREAAEASLRNHRLLLMGEIHGVAENPLIIERLVGELEIETVAVEWPPGLEAAYTDPAILACEPIPHGVRIDAIDPRALIGRVAWCGDGRFTAGHLALLRRLEVAVIGVDEPLWTSADARDAAMAANVEAALQARPGRVLFVAGNMHTRLAPHEHYTPAGAHLRQGRPDLCALEIHYRQRAFWNLESRMLEPRDPPPRLHVVLERATEAVVLRRPGASER